MHKRSVYVTNDVTVAVTITTTDVVVTAATTTTATTAAQAPCCSGLQQPSAHLLQAVGVELVSE
jgi:hypothetical protein